MDHLAGESYTASGEALALRPPKKLRYEGQHLKLTLPLKKSNIPLRSGGAAMASVLHRFDLLRVDLLIGGHRLDFAQSRLYPLTCGYTRGVQGRDGSATKSGIAASTLHCEPGSWNYCLRSSRSPAQHVALAAQSSRNSVLDWNPACCLVRRSCSSSSFRARKPTSTACSGRWCSAWPRLIS